MKNICSAHQACFDGIVVKIVFFANPVVNELMQWRVNLLKL